MKLLRKCNTVRELREDSYTWELSPKRDATFSVQHIEDKKKNGHGGNIRTKYREILEPSDQMRKHRIWSETLLKKNPKTPRRENRRFLSWEMFSSCTANNTCSVRTLLHYYIIKVQIGVIHDDSFGGKKKKRLLMIIFGFDCSVRCLLYHSGF